jgi:5'-nucleotidase
VNLPLAPRGMTWTRQAVRHYDGRIVPGKDPMGRNHFWFTVAPIEQTEPGTDLWAMERGYISITPLSLDLTDLPEFQRHVAKTPLDAPPVDPPTDDVPEDETP